MMDISSYSVLEENLAVPTLCLMHPPGSLLLRRGTGHACCAVSTQLASGCPKAFLTLQDRAWDSPVPVLQPSTSSRPQPLLPALGTAWGCGQLSRAQPKHLSKTESFGFKSKHCPQPQFVVVTVGSVGVFKG